MVFLFSFVAGEACLSFGVRLIFVQFSPWSLISASLHGCGGVGWVGEHAIF